jgi:hypothetical protein
MSWVREISLLIYTEVFFHPNLSLMRDKDEEFFGDELMSQSK